MFIETETTPNPATMKFLPGRVVMEHGSREFTDELGAAASPLASALFDLGDVTAVFFGKDFISVTAGPGTDWSALKPQVASLLLDHFVSQAPLFAPGSAGEIAVPTSNESSDEQLHDPADNDLVDQILDLIETRIRPSVARDGGDVLYRGFREGIVYLQMQGACSGCPSSSATLKHGIESLIKYYVPEVVEVQAA